jgi:molecular chaperone DnaK (HSP70)
LLPEAARRRHVAKRVETRLLSLADAAFECGCAAEPAIDETSQHGEDRDPRNPSGGETLELVAEPCAAQHGGGEDQHDQHERRTMLVFDMGAVAGSHA